MKTGRLRNTLGEPLNALDVVLRSTMLAMAGVVPGLADMGSKHVQSVAISRDGSTIAAGSKDHTVRWV
jgi:hypothetical protein